MRPEVEYEARLAQRMPHGQPTAVLMEIADTKDSSTLRALAAFHRRAATVPVCVYLALRAHFKTAVGT